MGTLATAVIREFEKFAKESGPQYSHCLDKTIKFHAFQIGASAHYALFDPIVKAYQLCHEGNDYFLPIIKHYVDQQKFKEVNIS